jgi:radical SAM-linked protein
MRVVLEYVREERVKYISHLDLMRTIQRAVRRAGIPIAYSQGFNPHPIMAFASALSVGVTSDGEYMDIRLSQPMDVRELVDRLNQALPKGITVKQAVEVDEKAPSLMSLIERADYRVVAHDPDFNWQSGIAAFRSKSEIWVEKKTKKGVSTINLKEGIYEIRLEGNGSRELYLSLKSGSRGNIRPELVISKLLELSGAVQGDKSADMTVEQETIPVSIHRVGLYFRQNGKWVTPLALKKD